MAVERTVPFGMLAQSLVIADLDILRDYALACAAAAE
jgi:hypothetical protein